MQKFVRPQERINYKIKKVINLSRFAMPILAVAIKKINKHLVTAVALSSRELGPAQKAVRCILTIPVSPLICDMPNGEPVWICRVTLEY